MLVLAVIAVVVALSSCAGSAVIVERGCSTTRTVEITRSKGEPERTTIRSAKVCGDHAPALPEPDGDARR